MTIDELKLAAKRLRKGTFSIPGEAHPISSLTHAQALDQVSRLHGYRDFHEASQRLARRQVLVELTQEVGGLVATQYGACPDISAMLLRNRLNIAVIAPSGRGKSILACELICQALIRGERVRVIATYGDYRRFCEALDGQYFDESAGAESAREAWSSDYPFVVVEQAVAKTFLGVIPSLPARARVVCDVTIETEALALEPLWQTTPAPVILTGYPNPRGIPSATWNTFGHLIRADHKANGCGWTWHEASTTHPDSPWAAGLATYREFDLKVGVRRLATFTTSYRHLDVLGRKYDQAAVDAFIRYFHEHGTLPEKPTKPAIA